MVRRQVRVALGHFDIGVTKELRDSKKVNAFHRQVRRKSMAKIMYPAVLDARSFEGIFPFPFEVAGIQNFSGRRLAFYHTF